MSSEIIYNEEEEDVQEQQKHVEITADTMKVIPPKIEISRPWGNVTDPRTHDPKNFRYLVHGIVPSATISMQLLTSYTLKDEAEMINEKDGDQSINLLINPEKLDQRVALSSSLVDEEHHGTWGKAGLIFEAPSENIVITSREDVGAFVMSKKKLKQQAESHDKLPADELLQQTHPSSYNEIVVLANNDGKKVVLTGFFYKATEDGAPMDEDLYREMSKHANKLNLPLVPLVEPNPYAENKIIPTKLRFAVNHGGKQYVWPESAGQEFITFDPVHGVIFPSPDEIESVLEYLRKNNVSNDKVESFYTMYQEADKLRQQPKIGYDKDGNITSVSKRSLYGTDQKEINIDKNGHAHTKNLIKNAKAISASLAGMTTRSYDWPISSPQEVEQVVLEAIVNASEDEKRKLEEWWSSIKDSIGKWHSM